MTQDELKAVYRTVYAYHMDCRKQSGSGDFWDYAATQLCALGQNGPPFLCHMLVEVYIELMREYSGDPHERTEL